MIDEATDAHSSRSVRHRFQRSSTLFVGGVLLGLLLGVAGALIVPDLLPEDQLDCEKPERVVWSEEGSGTQLEITYADDGADSCDAEVVFRELPQERKPG